jgi:hypothetical protein
VFFTLGDIVGCGWPVPAVSQMGDLCVINVKGIFN